MRRNATVRFANDDRARVPFALVGVLLLITSTTYVGVLTGSGTISEDRSVERAIERASADATPAVRHAASEAAREAARKPVTESANTVAGEAIREKSTFEDALRIRIYLAAEAALDATETRSGDVSAIASLPTVDDPANLDEARDRVDVEPADGGAAFTVTIRNVTTRATRDGRVVAESTDPVTATVAVPVLAAHERTDRFERRLNRDALDGPGLGRQLTARLYPITWARGYGQYGGAPITNVLGNHHIEMSTNSGLVRTQEAVFGKSAPGARRGVRRATARTAVTDLLAPMDVDEETWTDAVLDGPVETNTSDAAGLTGSQAVDDTPTPEDGVEVGVNRTADVAFEELLQSEFDETLRSAYRVEATLDTATTTVSDEGRPQPDSPGDNWTQVSNRVTPEYTVVEDDTPASDDDTTGFATATRTVVVTRTVVRQWVRGPDHRTTRSTWTERYRVVVAVDGEYAPAAGAPERPVDPIFESGGALDGPNLVDTPLTARRALDAEAVDDVAVRTVLGQSTTDRTVVRGEHPEQLRTWVYHDLAELREEVRNVSVTVDRGAIASGEANPPAALAAEIRDRRMELIGAPERYDGAADRARVAVRTAYVDAVLAELDRRARESDERTDRLTDSLSEAGIDSADQLDELLVTRTNASSESDDPVGEGTVTDPVGEGVAADPVTLSPHASPSYLPRTAVTDENVDAVESGDRTYLLATRNVNYATIPYGTASEGIVDAVLGEAEVPLRSAATTLAAADRTLAETDDDRSELRTQRDKLKAEVDLALRIVDRSVMHELRRRTDLTRSERREAIRAASERWNGSANRGAAAGTGAYAEAIVAEVDASTGLSERKRDRLTVRLRLTVRDAVEEDDARISEDTVTDTAELTRAIARSELEGAVESGLREGGERTADRWMPEAMRGVGAGIPVAPVPGYWYATVNVWHVEVRGVYPRFAVHADEVGSPGEGFAYVREAGTATVTVGGEEVVLGTVDPIEFEVGTTVVVGVPPGPPGVGDVDGVRDERSPGWPCPEDRESFAPERETCG